MQVTGVLRGRSAVLAMTAMLVASGTLTAAAATVEQQAGGGEGNTQRPTVLLVHGAWDDSSTWSGVIPRLEQGGYDVIAAANPLRGIKSDSAYIGSLIDSIKGPVVLVGHSYGGAVITNAATNRSNVKSLVYIAGWAVNERESLQDINARFPGSAVVEALNPVPFRDAGGTGTDLYIKKDKFRSVFAADVPAPKASIMAVTQRPFSAAAFEEKSGPAAWKKIPSWYMVARQDRAIPPAAERFMAKRANSVTVEVNASHVPQVSQPSAVSQLIVKAATAAAAGQHPAARTTGQAGPR